MAATSRDEFVDLYDVMDLPVESDSETIRQRLNTLYLEAQQNLDHRNAKKRIQYQQMYEIYLPQGRHLLLDPRRRAEYDRYLTAYRTGNKVAPSTPTEQEMPPSAPEIEEPPIPGMAEVQVDPAVLAAEREDMWAKWKVGLEDLNSAPEELEITAGASADAAPAANADAAQARPAPPTPRGYSAPTPRPRAGGVPAVPRTTPPAPRTRSARPAWKEEEAEAAKKDEAAIDLEKQRQQQRYTLIKDAVQIAGLMWGAIYAGVIFLVGMVALFFLDNYFKPRYPLGLSQSTFALIGFVLILIIAGVGGFFGARSAKRKAVSSLSMLSTEELLRRKRV